MPSIYGRDFQNQAAQARGRPANWAQGPMGSKPDPLQASLVAQRGFNNGPDPMQPTMAAQASFKNGGPMQPPAQIGGKIGSISPGAGPSISLPNDPLASALTERSFKIGGGIGQPSPFTTLRGRSHY